MHSLFKGLMIVLCLALVNCSPLTPRCPSPSHEQSQEVQQALTDFAVNLFRNVTSQNERKNQVISPLSIALGLALLESGADGQTRDEIKQALLETTSTREDVLNVYANLQQQLQIKQSKTQLTVANGLFQDKDLKLNDDFVALIKNCYKSELDQVDFKNQLEQTRQKVNQFISQKTQQKIPELFKQGDLNKDDRIVLANAVYFQASWKTAFAKRTIQQDTFYRSGHEPQIAEFVQQTVTLRHAECDEANAVELPYDDQDLSMVVVLPKTRDGLRQLEKNLSGQTFRNIFSRFQSKEVDVQLPKFQVRSRVDLKQVLTRMGLESLFSRTADFKRMSDTHLTIDSGVHEAYISVDENGTVGAAATGFAAKAMASIQHEEPALQFKVDHPFLYAVVHKQSGAIVFLGRVNSIEQE